MIMERTIGKRRRRRIARTRVIVLLAMVFLAAIFTGVWLLLLPYNTLNSAQVEQDALMDSILLTAQADTGVAPAAAAIQRGGITDADTGSEPVEPVKVSPVKASGYGVLTIGKINLKMPVVPGACEEQLKTAAGWVTQTAPVGEIGNAVIAGHRQYAYGRQFNRLGELEPGDIIQYQSAEDKTYKFSVYDSLVIEPDDQSVFDQPADRAILTLYTCAPVQLATHRLIVRAELIH